MLVGAPLITRGPAYAFRFVARSVFTVARQGVYQQSYDDSACIFGKGVCMKYRSVISLTILVGLLSCTNPLAPPERDLTPKSPNPYSNLPGWEE